MCLILFLSLIFFLDCIGQPASQNNSNHLNKYKNGKSKLIVLSCFLPQQRLYQFRLQSEPWNFLRFFLSFFENIQCCKHIWLHYSAPDSIDVLLEFLHLEPWTSLPCYNNRRQAIREVRVSNLLVCQCRNTSTI